MADASGLRADVQIHLLGPLELVVGGRLLPAGGPRQRALLALLALSVGVAVPPSRLVDLLWDDAPPPAAANTVQVYVSRLRRLFTADGSTSPLRSVSGAYLLDLPAEAVDARRFETLSERGRARLMAGEPASAAQDLRAALGLWRGAAVPDLAGTAVARAAVARLESMRQAVLADRIDADALLGRHGALIPELRGLVLQHPLDERFVGQLMTALYRAGRQAEAFAAYTVAADRLADELGVDPGPALRALHTRILRQDVDLHQQQDVALLSLPSPRAPLGENRPRAVPDQLISASLIGRRAELAELVEQIRRPVAGWITVVGPGGVGKSRLAAEVATVLRVLRSEPGRERSGSPVAVPAGPGAGAASAPIRVVVVSLAAVFDAAQIPVEICRVLGAGPDWQAEPPIEVAVRTLGTEPTVVILENAEQVMNGDLATLARRLAQVERLRVVATSRVALGVPGERLVPIGPLAVPRTDVGPGPVGEAEAGRLFRERARCVLPSFELTDANASAVATLCRRVEGVPLALELTAARVNLLSPEQILQRLDRQLALPGGAATRSARRHRSLWAALDFSARLLDSGELLLFGQLSAFVDGWTLEAAEEVCGLVFDSDVIVADVLARLTASGLVVALGNGRFGMLETVRDYAREVLEADPPVAAITRDRHAAHYAGLVEELGPQSRRWLESVAPRPSVAPSPRIRLDQEAGNLTLALEYAAGDRVAGDRVDGELLGRLVAGLLEYWFAAGRLSEADRWFQAARRAESSPALRARLLLTFGNLTAVGGDLTTAAEVLAEAHDVALRVGDTLLLVRTFAARAVAARYLGQCDQAFDLLTGALATLAGTRGGSRVNAETYCGSGDFDSSEAEAGTLDVTGLERALQNELAEVMDELDLRREAVRLWQECRRWAATMDAPVQLAYPLVNLARTALERDGGEEARALIADALAAAQASGSTPVLADVIAAAGLVDHRTGRSAPAVAQLRAALRLGHHCGRLLPLSETVSLLGSALVNDEPMVAIRLLAAAQAWRNSRSIMIVSRVARDVLAEAEVALAQAVAAGQLSTEQVDAERRRGTRTPFGSLCGLFLLDPGLRPQLVTLDLTGEPGSVPVGGDQR